MPFIASATRKAALIGALAALGTGTLAAANVSGSVVLKPTLDHMLCYTAKAGRGFHIPTHVILKNQFSRRGFAPKIGGVVLHCNPVEKILPAGRVFKITNPRAHLLCFVITAAQQPARNVIVSNQFGRRPLIVGQPMLLCLPSWKKLTGPPRMKPVQPPGLDHFTCYPVKLPTGVPPYNPPPGIKLRDQFARQPVAVQISGVPVALCLPTEKIVGTHATKIINPKLHLLCFPVSQTPIKPRVFDQNQFGTAVIRIGRTAVLCLPSRKQLLPPPPSG